MLKCISKNITFTCIPLKPAYLLNNNCKINKKDQYLHKLIKIYMLKVHESNYNICL